MPRRRFLALSLLLLALLAACSRAAGSSSSPATRVTSWSGVPDPDAGPWNFVYPWGKRAVGSPVVEWPSVAGDLRLLPVEDRPDNPPRITVIVIKGAAAGTETEQSVVIAPGAPGSAYGLTISLVDIVPDADGTGGMVYLHVDPPKS